MTNLVLTAALLAVAAGGCDPANPPLQMSYRSLDVADSSEHALDRQTVLSGNIEISVRLGQSCSKRHAMRWFSINIGSEPLCMANAPEESCIIDFGKDMNSWALTVKTSLRDQEQSLITQSERMLTTLNAGFQQSGRRRALSRSGSAIQERASADRIPHDDIWRTALVLDRKGRPRTGLTLSDFSLTVSGVGGERLVEARPMSEVDEPRLLFMLLDVSDNITTKDGWRRTYRSLVNTIIHGLGKVIAPERRLLVIRYAGSAQSSPIVALDEEGIRTVEGWLLSAPLQTWKSGITDRTTALLRAYDIHLHDFEGQPLGLILSGGRDNLSEDTALVAAERYEELNPVWSEEKLAALVSELDLGLTDLFPHTEQRGFPLSWVYLPSTYVLTRGKFEQASAYYRSFGGEVYGLADASGGRMPAGQEPSGGTFPLDAILRIMFDEIENSYLLRLRIPNPHQERTEQRIKIRAGASTVRTQKFYQPSASLQASIERYLASATKERRFRAAFAAREYPLDDRIYRKVQEWLREEPSPQVRPMLEESALLMEFKRAQVRDGSSRRKACEKLRAAEPAAANRSLHRRLLELAAAGSCAEKD